MNNSINENEALEKLGVKSFREVSKEKVMELMSLIPDMEPEVAVKALEQFPQFVSCAVKALSEYKEVITKAINSADTGLQEVLKGRLIVIDSLSKILEEEKITIEQKLEVANRMKELGDLNSEELGKHRDFLIRVSEIIAAMVFGTIWLAATTLGGRAKVGA